MGLNSIAPWIVVKCPWIPVMFLVPLCILYDLYCYLRLRVNYFLRWRSGRAGRVHEDKVRRVQEQVHDWIKQGRKTKMCTARPSEFLDLYLQLLVILIPLSIRLPVHHPPDPDLQEAPPPR